jgi:hypothetical protein
MWRRSDSVSGDHFECPNRAVLLDKVWDASRRLWLFGGVALLALDAALGHDYRVVSDELCGV